MAILAHALGLYGWRCVTESINSGVELVDLFAGIKPAGDEAGMLPCATVVLEQDQGMAGADECW